MRFFSGFGFKDDIMLFKDLLDKFGYKTQNDYSICGFSKGTQKALNFTLNAKTRINRLILLSPAFFHDKDSAFKKLQITQFNKNKKLYMNAFYKNVGIEADSAFLREIDELDSTQLSECLYYEFKKESLSALQKKGVEIIVFVGEKDKIINAKATQEFFSEFGIVYFVKNANHLLKIAS